MLRLSAVIIGLALGFAVAWFTGRVDFANMAEVPLISVPQPFKYGFGFDWIAFVPVSYTHLDVYKRQQFISS